MVGTLDDESPVEPETEIETAILRSIEESAKQALSTAKPGELFVIPVTKRPFFPGMAAPLMVEPGPFFEILKLVAQTETKCIVLSLTKEENVNPYEVGLEDLHQVGTLARILRVLPSEQGGAQVILNMESRVVIEEPVDNDHGFLRAQVSYPESETPLTEELKAYAISILSCIKELLQLNPLFKEELQILLGHSDYTEPGRIADFAAALTTAEREELQEILETFDIPTRIEKALKILRKELDLSQLQTTINQKVDSSLSKNQREYFLREQLKTIKRELGIEKDDKSCDQEKFEARIKERIIPDEVQEAIDEEMDKLAALEPQSAEYAVSRNYLDWLTVLPWGIRSEDSLDLKTARDILEEDHYGLKDIKERIMEFIGVGRLTGGVRGTILCLVGPPGVGKTSVGRSIARALNRKFYRFSVGGMRDEAEIKGHRRTYIGAMPGKLIQALKVCGTMNPVVMLDEVDKMGSSYQGDPASALLEVLDPEQNRGFLDHYLDVRCDLSQVLFIVTANVLDTIPEPLQDRMEILRLSGYIVEEKLEIASKYLLPRHRKEMGLKTSDVQFTKEGLKAIINGYARESGVRSLENHIKKVLRKVAVSVVEEQSKKRKPKKPKTHRVSKKSVSDYLGKPKFLEERFYMETPIGVATGLAWTALGGEILFIESVDVPAEKPELRLTGQAGEVMKESSEIAWSYLHSALEKYAPNRAFFERARVHMHIPEGSVPKDGPSAGITMVTSLLSLLLKTEVIDGLGMTGELTLTGRILGIGGVKEKVVAARRNGLTHLLFPEENRRDIEELEKDVRGDIKVDFVEHYDDVFAIAFPKVAKRKRRR